jgi:uncharacterized repeat protein (TIGR04138 family)
MARIPFDEGVERCLERDARYAREAYFFIRDSLQTAQELMQREGHVQAKELLEGFRHRALQEFGPLAATVLSHWGIGTTDDVGRIVFNLIENEVFSRTDNDRPEDFNDQFQFTEAFDEPYLPPSQRGLKKKSTSV